MDSWGFGNNQQYVPADEEIGRALNLVDYGKVEVDPGKATVFLTEPGMSLDLGGVAKGYAMDKAVKGSREVGIKHALINAVDVCMPWGPGRTENHGVWASGPAAAGHCCHIIFKGFSSGDIGVISVIFEQEGVLYHHIIDPSTGKQARN